MRLALVLFAAIALSEATQEPLSIAIMREDGYLVPLVLVHADDYEPLTVAAADVLGLSEWRLWRLDRTEPESVRTLGRAIVHTHCSDEEAWQTTFKGKPVEKYVADIRKVGVAVGNGEVTRPEDLAAQPDESSRRATQLIVSLAHSREAERLEKEPGNPLHKFDRDTRAGRAVIIEKLIRHHNSGKAIYYFEAVKKYGYLRAFTTGWLVEDGRRLRTRDVTFQMDDDDHKENERARILGIIRHGQRQLWLMVVHGYEGEGYAIREWPAGRVIDNLGGGGC